MFFCFSRYSGQPICCCFMDCAGWRANILPKSRRRQATHGVRHRCSNQLPSKGGGGAGDFFIHARQEAGRRKHSVHARVVRGGPREASPPSAYAALRVSAGFAPISIFFTFEFRAADFGIESFSTPSLKSAVILSASISNGRVMIRLNEPKLRSSW